MSEQYINKAEQILKDSWNHPNGLQTHELAAIMIECTKAICGITMNGSSSLGRYERAKHNADPPPPPPAPENVKVPTRFGLCG